MNDNISVDKNTKKFEIFWKRFSDEYPIAYDSVINHYKKISSAWKKISPSYGKSTSGTFSIDEDGELTGSMPFWISIGLISEYIIQFITEHTLNENELNACDILPAMNGGASHEEEGWRNAVNVV